MVVLYNYRGFRRPDIQFPRNTPQHTARTPPAINDEIVLGASVCARRAFESIPGIVVGTTAPDWLTSADEPRPFVICITNPGLPV